MKVELWSGLLANFAVLALFLFVASQAQGWLERLSALRRSLAFGVLMGFAALAIMLFPVEMQPGILFDLRAAPLALSGFFAGPIGGLVTLAIAGASRLAIGGAGAVLGTAGMAITLAIGVAGYFIHRRRQMRARDVVWLGAFVSLGAVAKVALVPPSLWPLMIGGVFPTTVLIFVSTIVAGMALLRESQRRQATRESAGYRRIMESLPDSLNVKDLDGRFIAANPATALLLQADGADAVIGKTDFDFFSAADAQRFREDELKVIAVGEPVTGVQQVSNPLRGPIWMSTLKAPLRDRSGKVIGVITHNRDVTDQKRLELEYSQSQRRFAYALEQMSDGLAMFGGDGRLIFCNEQYRAFFPRTGDLRVPGAAFRDILQAAIDRGEQIGRPQQDGEKWIEEVAASLFVEGDEEVHLFDGRWLQIRTRPTLEGSSMVVVSEVTRTKEAEASLRSMADQLQLLASTDSLTGLANRRIFDQTLEQEMARGSRSGSPLSVALIDIDHFKAFNDLYGHPAGDKCLRVVADCLRQALKRPTDLAARYGGEEFVAILPDTNEDGAFAIGDEFRVSLKARGLEHAASSRGVVTASVGIASSIPGDAITPLELLSRADEALYSAKHAGRDRITGWNPRRQTSRYAS